MGMMAPLQAGISYASGAGADAGADLAFSNPYTAIPAAVGAAAAYGFSPTVRHYVNGQVGNAYHQLMGMNGQLQDNLQNASMLDQNFPAVMSQGYSPGQSLLNLNNPIGQNQAKVQQPKQQGQQQQQNPYQIAGMPQTTQNPYYSMDASQYQNTFYPQTYQNQSQANSYY
jgi:hypothetical protein